MQSKRHRPPCIPFVCWCCAFWLCAPLSADTITWSAPTGSDGLASTASNWSLGRVPLATDDIVLDATSLQSMTWNAGVNGLPTTVASWSQSANFTGSVTFTTVYEGDFTCFNVVGDVSLSGGSWTHPANADSQIYRLNIAVGGDFTVGAAAILDARAKGYAIGCFPEGGALGVHAGGNTSGAVYGNVYHPEAIGAGNSLTGTEYQPKAYPGGGAIKLVVAGAFTLDGELRVDSTSNRFGGLINTSNPHHAAGAAGSAWIQAASMLGSGKLYACGNALDRGSRGGSGGRVAIELSSAESLAFPLANIFTYGTLNTYDTELGRSGCAGGGTLVVKTPSQTYGTLYVSNVMRQDIMINRNNVTEYTGYGITVPSELGTTIIPAGETWTFDGIVFNGNGYTYRYTDIDPGSGTLMIPEGTTLVLPNGLASVRGESLFGGILMNGGTLSLPDGTQTLQTPWTFSAAIPYTLNHDLIVKDGASLGALPLSNRIDSPRLTDLTVNGDLTVETNGLIHADTCGYCPDADIPAGGPNGFYYSHGGQSGYYGYTNNAAYGSVLNPIHPGANGYWYHKIPYVTPEGVSKVNTPHGSAWKRGGGALKLTVTGTLTLNGKATARGMEGLGQIGGTGGSLNFTVGELLGSGTIQVSGSGTGPNGEPRPSQSAFPAENTRCYTGGGRIAIRLTAPGAMLDPAWLTNRLRAYGQMKQAAGYNQMPYMQSGTSAGTIYIQEAGVPEGHGTIYIDNRDYDDERLKGVDNWVQVYNTTAYTHLPSLEKGRPIEQLRHATLVVRDYAHLAVGYNTLAVKEIRIENSTFGSNSQKPDRTGTIELNGNILKTESLTILGNEIPPGTYQAGDPEFSFHLQDKTASGKPWVDITVLADDAEAGGVLIVTGDDYPTVLSVR